MVEAHSRLDTLIHSYSHVTESNWAVSFQDILGSFLATSRCIFYEETLFGREIEGDPKIYQFWLCVCLLV